MEQENKFLVPIAIVIAGALIAWGFLSDKEPNTTDDKIPTVEQISVDEVTEADHILGNPNADVILVEYSDIDCPYCKNFYATAKKLMDDFGKDGKFAIVFRHFPLEQLHPYAKTKAIATECAAELGGNTKFWEYMDKMIDTTADFSDVTSFAQELGFNKAKFDACMKDNKMAKRVQEDYDSGIKAGVLGTPAEPGGTPYSVLVIKDGTTVPVKGAQPYDVVKLMIQTALTDLESRN